jgi:hypothetical protein
MLATILNHPDTSIDGTIDEFCAAFGPAKPSVKEYFNQCESNYPQYSAAEPASRIKAKQKYGAGHYGPYYQLAGENYTPKFMATARTILDKARAEAAKDETASARVDWLIKGLTHADLILAAQRAFEHGVDTGDKSDFTKAIQALASLRAENADYDKSNFAGLTGDEKAWTRARR